MQTFRELRETLMKTFPIEEVLMDDLNNYLKDVSLSDIDFDDFVSTTYPDLPEYVQDEIAAWLDENIRFRAVCSV
jgi:hypothetical protein